jgi:hypothetical protein
MSYNNVVFFYLQSIRKHFTHQPQLLEDCAQCPERCSIIHIFKNIPLLNTFYCSTAYFNDTLTINEIRVCASLNVVASVCILHIQSILCLSLHTKLSRSVTQQ